MKRPSIQATKPRVYYARARLVAGLGLCYRMQFIPLARIIRVWVVPGNYIFTVKRASLGFSLQLKTKRWLYLTSNLQFEIMLLRKYFGMKFIQESECLKINFHFFNQQFSLVRISFRNTLTALHPSKCKSSHNHNLSDQFTFLTMFRISHGTFTHKLSVIIISTLFPLLIK